MATATAAEMITPPALARRWGVAPDKILSLIHSGQLTAVNLAVDPKGRPRFRITEEAIEKFEQSRSTKPPTREEKRRRRTRATGVKQYF